MSLIFDEDLYNTNIFWFKWWTCTRVLLTFKRNSGCGIYQCEDSGKSFIETPSAKMFTHTQK